MHRQTFVLVILLLVASVSASAQHPSHMAAQQVGSGRIQTAYVCPMHPKVKSDKPGKCPECGMALVRTEAAPAPPAHRRERDKLRQARTLIDEAKARLAKDGTYGCCTKHSCDECALAHFRCDCAEDLKAGKPVCGTCYGGWQRGEGAVPGIKTGSVKPNFHSHGH